MTEFPHFLDDLNEIQRELCISESNHVITASPGSGKTRLITYRLAYLQLKYASSRKYNIAITYTNRAAEEIESRLEHLNVEGSSVWSGTIHQFCMNFIIRPYAMYSDYLKNGYKIIDEYITNLYCNEIAKAVGIDIRYKDPLKFPEIKKVYRKKLQDNKELDFQLILELSLSLLKETPFISENIASIIQSLHIDEFQDTNELQYEILAKIVHYNKKINVIFVGDENQAIYGNLGGMSKSVEEISDLFEMKFIKSTLQGCYRSTSRIIDFYTNFEVSKTGTYSLSKEKDLPGIIKYNTKSKKEELVENIKNIIIEQVSNGVPANEICIVAPQWYQIFTISNKLKKELPDLNFDSPDISTFKYDPLNPFYLLAKLLFTKSGVRVHMRKRIANELISILKFDYNINLPEWFDNYSLLKEINGCVHIEEDGMCFYESSVNRIMKSMNIELNQTKSLKNTFDDFMNKCNDRISRFKISTTYNDLIKCFSEKNGIVINTIHGVKGEEYTTVIAYGLLNGKLPNWDYILGSNKHLRTEETNKLLYVLASRAKKNLFMFSEKGMLTDRGKEYTPTDELQMICFDYD